MVDLRGKLPIHSSKKYKSRKQSDIRSFAIHHSLTVSGSAEAFAGYHVRTNGWPGIGYAYVIGRDGTIYWCWDWSVVSYHVGDSNKHALGICLVGDFRTQTPTPAQYKSTVELVRWLQTQIPTATAVKGHSEYPGYSWKECPVINVDNLRAAVAATGEGEEPMTPEERKAFAALQNQVAELAKANSAYKDRIQALEKLHRMDVPSWAKASADAAVNAGLINTPDGGSYDFYRFLTLSHRAKIF